MERIVMEAGSTCTKIDMFDGKEILHIDTVAIEFKRHYQQFGKIIKEDIEELINLVKKIQGKYDIDIFVCGTSIFRELDDSQKDDFLRKFKEKTNIEFNIISSKEENVLTVKGATKNINEALVFVGGGGSTEISYYSDGIKDMCNNSFGVMDILKVFPDLGENIATTSLEEVMEYIQERIDIPDVSTDILILAGGGHEYFAKNSGISYNINSIYTDKYAPIMMDIEQRIEDTYEYYMHTSLDEIRKKVSEPKWWYATRAMCAFVLVVAKKIGAKYIVPTDISMIHGIVL